MIKSMTGYGKGECTLSDHSKVTVEIRSLNGKNAEINLKGNGIPKEKEIEVRKMIASELVRGSIECNVTQSFENASGNKMIDARVVGDYFRQAREILEKESGTNIEDHAADACILASVLKFPDVISVRSETMTEEDWKMIEAAVKTAADRLSDYRETEGKALYKDVTSRVVNIGNYLEEVKKEDVKRAPAVKERIRAKIEEAGLNADPARLEQ